jgi:hypothetical protein
MATKANFSAGEGALDSSGLLSAFPPIDFAFGYGSGVFRQASYAASDVPMVDCVFAVSDPVKWHRENLATNRSHYSVLGVAGPRVLAFIQERFGAGLYYNTDAPLPPAARGLVGQRMKYGVISVAALLDDLLNWRYLYVAGRLQKPVHVLGSRGPQSAILAALEANRRHALTVALLSLPQSFTAWQLYVVGTVGVCLRGCASARCAIRASRLPIFPGPLRLLHAGHSWHLVLGRLPHGHRREPKQGRQHCPRQRSRVSLTLRPPPAPRRQGYSGLRTEQSHRQQRRCVL